MPVCHNPTWTEATTKKTATPISAAETSLAGSE
jgi:hypothetical protein